jgi:ankyrin repeat protein
MSALYTALSRDNLREVRQLLEQGADPNARNEKGRTILSAARSPAAIELLLKHGADPNSTVLGNITPLMNAASWGQSDTVALLLRHGARVDLRNAEGSTALHYAAQSHGVITDYGRRELTADELRNCLETIRLLIAAGADLQARNNQGRTPLDDVALTQGPPEFSRALREG